MKGMAMLSKFWRDDDGGELVEWPLLVSLIALGLLGVLTALNVEILGLLTSIKNEVAAVPNT